MNIKCSVYIATSIDSFIAGPNGDIDWLNRPEYVATEMQGLRYEDFISTVDALVMGRNTYEKVLTFDTWPYGETPVVVLSSREITIPEEARHTVRLEAGAPQAIVTKLAAEGKKHLYIDGGVTIQRFLAARLIDEITITRIPILLGTGIPLFGVIGVEQKLRLLHAIPSDNGFVQERYAVLH